ncbi:EndoU domain-containing protein [Nocardia asteroides]|uniref:EndoU domain-containing protein n=1 Tax=Nocardia asteroides TaxID=1824 RepID=UPI001E424AC9|nr:EndoU domain-containing protein [Nocardia asteroides]UGT57779.1 EndoU domain-containing protein [Nocardia asteroides]
MAAVSPQSYESAAMACYDLSEKFQTVYETPQSVLLETNAMAGGYEAVKSWSKAYDDRAAALTMVATNFARALQHFGDILTVSSYNWNSAEHTANRNPNKGEPPSLPTNIPSELPYGAGAVVGIASSGAYTDGLQTDWTELQNKVATLAAGGQVPDGDTDKLARAATMWKTFANSDPLEYGVGRLQTVASGLEQGFGSEVPDDIPNHTANLRKLADKLREIRIAAHDIANAVEAHNVALTKMRADINTQFAAVVSVTAISIGRSMVNVKEQPAKEKAPSKQPSQSTNDNKVEIDIDFLNDAAWAIAGPANAFLATLSTLNFTTAPVTNGDLLAIVELPITVTTVDPAQSTNGLGTQWDKVQGPVPSSISMSQMRRIHILDGDGKGNGGHAPGVGIPGKHEFPDTKVWTDDHIINSIQDVAKNPDQVPVFQNHGTWKVTGTRDGVLIEVIVDPSGNIVTGYPVSGPGVYKNDENGNPIK